MLTPNFLIIIVDEERFPPVYENEEIKAWRKKYLKAQRILHNNGLTFNNHYTGSTACSPSRGTLYTGQYPSLHGVSQTGGVAKGDFDADMFWLDQSTVPTIGDYLFTEGYEVFWKGKWHASQADILIPDTHDSFLSYNSVNGIPEEKKEKLYLNANRLGEFGFDKWIGPEPFGSEPHNSGSSASVGISGRDEVYSMQVVDLIKSLDNNKANKKTFDNKPWAIVCSFVNPHDIALFGEITRLDPLFDFKIDKSVPFIPKSPTATESLSTKPKAQSSYREVYPKALQPLIDTEFYRKLYYSLQLQVDNEMCNVLTALFNSSFYEDTIIIFTSDHGEMLGSHGGLFQKWYQAYEESIHVPLIIHNPILFKESKQTNILTSHVDILPTILGLANIDQKTVQNKLKRNHTEVHPLVGRDLSPIISQGKNFERINEPIYFMTDDDVTKGLNQKSVLGIPYESVIQPNHVETVIAKLQTGKNNQEEIWKYSRYFDNPQFWSSPGCEDETITQQCPQTEVDGIQCCLCIKRIKTTPDPDEFEMYNLTTDPLETKNLAHSDFQTPETKVIQVVLSNMLEQQCRQKRIYPSSGNVPGKPSCKNCAPDLTFR
ncbi:MAG: sulfatase-like hydrolase/transferase [Tepidibacter sp.]|jgi:arylsulfatase A-like enzyme|uniref:sulfatase-like hydrolase/transferase n=1 Tax=Tepidibacter sp. TaxID=2529387 RepID=UPI0025F829F3|nr:sulfatase-like hydrolase/transferase [Tepidibacter sp.]MCT4507403.1 sulfatase-like hydrolase/transferase [Tepidibacter sp.]